MLTAIFSFLLMILVCILIAILVKISNSFVKFGFCLVIIILFVYLHPSKEYITCDINYSCTIRQEYLKVFRIEKDFNLSINANIETNIYNIPFWFMSADISDNYYIKINFIDKDIRIKPFVYYIDIQKSEDLANDYAKNLSSDFNQYIKNPQKGFKIESKASSIYSGLLISLVVLFLLLYKRAK